MLALVEEVFDIGPLLFFLIVALLNSITESRLRQVNCRVSEPSR